MGDPALRRPGPRADPARSGAPAGETTRRPFPGRIRPAAWTLSLGLALSLSLSGCGGWAIPPKEPSAGPGLPPLAGTGERQVAGVEGVSLRYACAGRRLPFLHLEDSLVVPERVVPGQTLDHRLVYVLCPDRAERSLGAELRTRVYRGRRLVVERRDTGFRAKPGRWVVDSQVQVPASAPAGLYALEVEVRAQGQRLAERRGFRIE